MMQLKDILYKAGTEEIRGDAGIWIKTIASDSRAVSEGALFVAVKGTTVDSHQFIDQVTERGAVAVICEHLPETIRNGITYVRVRDSRLALGVIASNFYGNPSEKLKLVGISGTNGKTTTATLLYNLLTAMGYKCGLISTIRVIIGKTDLPATHTTPDAIQLNQLLQRMVSEGVVYCFMEVSSHAIDQKRIAGLVFAGGVFTNITHDHLDYHKTFDAYLKAKKAFYDALPPSSFALSNLDDRNGQVMLQNTRASKHYYSIKSLSTFHARIIENSFDGLHLEINGKDAWFRLTGDFNAYNLLAVYATAVLLGFDPDSILLHLSSLKPAEGRFEVLVSESGIRAIVDYAHTPDALYNVLRTLQALRTGNERLITITGAGGNRDKAKRPKMAAIASEYSDLVILTSDNPRDEDPRAIIEEMRSGIPAGSQHKALAIENRREAIRTACTMARPGDIILLAGKGHEKYQEIKGVKYPFDDKEILAEALHLTGDKIT